VDSLSAHITSPFAHNDFNCCSYINTSAYELWHLTLAYIFKLHIDKVDIYTYCKAHMYAVGTAECSIWNKQIDIKDNSLNDLDTFIDFYCKGELVFYCVLCNCSCIIILYYF